MKFEAYEIVILRNEASTIVSVSFLEISYV